MLWGVVLCGVVLCCGVACGVWRVACGVVWRCLPVLSNRMQSILPANGTLYGSVQKIPLFMRAIRAVFTAIAVCIGSERGTTDVMMMTHRRRSSDGIVSTRG